MERACMEIKPAKLAEENKTEEKLELREYCQQCNKPVGKGRQGSITQWLFHGQRCDCSARDSGEPQQTAADDSSEQTEPAGVSASASASEASEQVSTATVEILAAGLMARQHPNLLIGKTIGQKYQVLEYLGSGLTGYVFKVQCQGLPGVFVLKIIEPSMAFTRRHSKKFLQEAALAKELDHHNIIALYDAGTTDDDIPFLVTDYFPGERLSEILKEDGPYKETKAIELFLQICEGLNHAHACGILHRDIKPGNVRIGEGENPTIKIADCGVSRVLPNSGRDTKYFTDHGYEYGDATYMSPEQCTGKGLDQRSDIYSLGCLMYQCLSGKPPFSSERSSMLMYKHVRKLPRPLTQRFPGIELSRDLESIVMRCLEKDPDNRYQSVADVKADLEAVKAGKRVFRRFRRKLSSKGKSLFPDLPESIFAPPAAVWFRLSTTKRLWSLIVVFLFIGTIGWQWMLNSWFQHANFIRPDTTLAQKLHQELGVLAPFAAEIEVLLSKVHDDLEYTAQNDPTLEPFFEKLRKDIENVKIRFTHEPEVWTIEKQKVVLSQLRKELSVLETRLSSVDFLAAGSHSIIDTMRSKTLFSTTEGTDKRSTVELAIKSGADLTRADLRGYLLSGLSFKGGKLLGADFTNADLRGVTFDHCDLSGADFSYCDMRHIRMIECTADNAEFVAAEMEGATITNSSFDNTVFDQSNLTDLDFIGGSMNMARMDGCNLENYLMFTRKDASDKVELHADVQRAMQFKRSLEQEYERLYEAKFALEQVMAYGGTVPDYNDAVFVTLPGSPDKRVQIKSVDGATEEGLVAEIERLSNRLKGSIHRVQAAMRLSLATSASSSKEIEQALKEAKSEQDALRKEYGELDRRLDEASKAEPKAKEE